MPTHHILCIHGIGEHSNDWVNDAGDGESFAQQFFALLKRYPSLKGVDPDNVKLHSIHYDDELLKLFASWEEQVKTLKAGLASSPLLGDQAGWYTDLIDKATAARTAGAWQFTHLFDLLLFAGSPSIQDRLVSYVGRQIAELIDNHYGDHFSLIGHSMGTAMAHKVIQALFNEGYIAKDGSRQTIRGDFCFRGVTMIANASYALSRDRERHYDGIVRPSMTVGEGCCYKWINVNHCLDPVGQFMPFEYRRNPQWLDPRVESRGYHRDLQLHRISSPSIHSIRHYFADPSFHIPFFELTFSKRFASKQRDEAIRAFESESPEGRFKALQAHFRALDVSNTYGFRDFYVALKAFIDVIKQYP
jgi:hypothetical protein